MADTVHLLVTDPAPGLRVISFNNPARKNAVNRATYVGLRQALDEASADDSVAVIALTGAGEFFSSGNDLGHMAQVDDIEALIDTGIAVVRRLVQSFVRCPKLLVAVVNGPAIGIAATIVALCDIVYAVDTAYFHTPFTQLGLSAEGGSSYTFPKVLGPSKAAEMLLLSIPLSAREAHAHRFVAELFTVGELQTKLWPRLAKLPELAQQSLRATKQLMRQWNETELLGAVEQEMRVLRERMQSEEALTAVLAFVARSKRSGGKAKL